MTGKIDKKWTAILVAFPAALSVLDPHLQFSILPEIDPAVIVEEAIIRSSEAVLMMPPA